MNILANRTKDHDAVFNAAWTLSKRLGFLFNAFSSNGNPWGYEVHHVVYLRLLRMLHRMKPGYIPVVRVANEDVIANVCRNGSPTVIVALHSPVDAVLSRVLQERGFQQAAVAANPETVGDKAAILGFQGQQHFIASTENTLLQIRRELRRNGTVHLCIDFRGDDADKPGYFMSSSIFKLTKLMALNVVFLDTQVTRGGQIKLYMQVHQATEADTPHDVAGAFLHWLKTDRGHTRNWTIVQTRPER
ncbi:hypothetical protein [Anderseniella sp. Alg231-50]|uniref:hypothetical protein n=1 Tax=Anderseniella sp. Alg231-50 TaxID=1922226 RepID=UPI00307B9021